MTELEVKVKDGKIYLPKSFVSFYPNQKEVILWFRQTGYSKLLHDLGLTLEESKDLEERSNQIVCIRTNGMFDEFLDTTKKVFGTEPDQVYKTKLVLDAIYDDCIDLKFDKMYARVPIGYSNFSAGEFICIISSTDKEVYAEVWDKAVWEKIKTYLIENKKVTKSEFEKYVAPRKKKVKVEQIKKTTNDEDTKKENVVEEKEEEKPVRKMTKEEMLRELSKHGL